MRRIFCLALALLIPGAVAAAVKSEVADAAQRGDKAAVRALILERRPMSTRRRSTVPTALHWAVQADDLELADLLIHAGANVSAADRRGRHAAVAGRHQRQRRDDRAPDRRPAPIPTLR